MAQELKRHERPAGRLALVTGATGFVGTILCNTLAERGWIVRRAMHSSTACALPPDCFVGNINAQTDWRQALPGVDVVVHLAARTHIMKDKAADPYAAYREINVDGTRALVNAAREAAVRRFVFLSSIKVNGESTVERPFSETDMPAPEDAYGVTKFEAERLIAGMAGPMEFVILRPPLIYGPGVKGNFARLMRAVERGIPLPLASIKNQRSLLYVGNLVDALTLCMEHPRANGQTYLVADDDAVATPALVRGIAAAMHKPPRLWPFPPALLRVAGMLTGKTAAIARLAGSLLIDSSKIREELAWQPRFTLEQGLVETVQWYDRRAI